MSSNSRLLSLLFASSLLLLVVCVDADDDYGWDVRIGVIGDFGRVKGHGAYNTTGEVPVGDVVKDTLQPDLIVTTGDNNYPKGANDTIDENIGSVYSEWIYPFRGDANLYPPGTTSRFLPALGNHDGYTTMNGVQGWPYLNYFSQVPEMVNKSNPALARRYYDFQRGPIHFLMLNSNTWEPDGFTADSAQAQWAKDVCASSTSKYRIIIWHHLAYSNNDNDHMTPALREWPFKEMGVSIVMSGHAHCYERFVVEDGTIFTVNGLGGTVPLYPHFEPNGRIKGHTFPIPFTQAWFNTTWGYQVISANDTMMRVSFHSLPSYDSQGEHKGIYYDEAVIYPLGSSYSSDDKDKEEGGSLWTGFLIGCLTTSVIFGIVGGVIYYRATNRRRNAFYGDEDNLTKEIIRN